MIRSASLRERGFNATVFFRLPILADSHAIEDQLGKGTEQTFEMETSETLLTLAGFQPQRSWKSASKVLASGDYDELATSMPLNHAISAFAWADDRPVCWEIPCV